MNSLRDWFPVVKVPVVSSDNFITNSICKCLTCHPFGNMNTICNKDNLPRPKPSQEIKTISSLIDKFTVIGSGRPISSSSLSSQLPPPHLTSSSSFLPPLPSLTKYDPNNYYNCYEYNRNVQQIINLNTKDLTANRQNRHYQQHHHNHHGYNNNNNRNFNIEMKHERFTPCQPNTTITNNNSVPKNNEDNIDADDAADGDNKIATNAKISSCSTTTTEIITITPNIRISSVKQKVTTVSSNKLSTTEEKSKNDDNEMAVVVVAPPRRKKRTNKKQQKQFQELIHSNGSSTDMSSLETNLESIENNNKNDAESREIKLLNNLDRPSKNNLHKNYVNSDQNNNCGSSNDDNNNNNNELMHIKTDIIDNIKEQTNNVLNINNIIDFNNNNNIDNNKSINNNNNNKSGCSSVDLVSSSLEKNILNLNIKNSTMAATTMPKTKMTISNNSVTNKYIENMNTGNTKIPDNFSVNNGTTPNHIEPNLIGYSKYNKVYYKESNVRDDQKYPGKSCSHCGRGVDMNMTENTKIHGDNYVNDDDYCNNNNYTMDDIYNDEILVCESIFTFNGNDKLKTRQIVPLPLSSSSTSPAKLIKPPPPPKDSTYTKFCSDSLYGDKSFEADEIFTNSSFESQFEDMINRLRNENKNNNYRLISGANLMSSSPFKKFCLPKQNKRRTRHSSLIKDFGLLPSVHRTTAISKTNNDNVHQVKDEPVVTTEDEMIIEEFTKGFDHHHHHHNHHHHSQKSLVNNATNTVAPDIIQHENSSKKHTSYRYHDTKLTKCSNNINSKSTIIHSYKPKCIRKIEC